MNLVSFGKVLRSLKISTFLSVGLMLLSPVAPSRAVDHNNLDEGFPLSFDDAESLAYGEQALELGAILSIPENRTLGAALELEYMYGFALNSHLRVGVEPRIGGRADSTSTAFEVDNISVGVFHNFNREYDNVPAFALRGDVAVSTGVDSEGLDLRLRGIASKMIGQYDRLHLNLDLNLTTATESGDRSFLPEIILGYSRPLGYPERFDQTFLAELGIKPTKDVGGGGVIVTGIGLRQQVAYQGVFDVGIQGHIVTSGEEKSELRLIAGYSMGF